MSDYSFDIVSKVDLQELSNAVVQAEREIATRFDFKGSKTQITLDKDELTIVSDDDYKLNSVIDILLGKMVKRNVPTKNLDYGKIEGASGGTVRQKIKIRQGIEQDIAKKINTAIKDSKLKVKSQIQGDQLRVSGKNKDDLQSVIQLLRNAKIDIDLQFINFR